MKQKLHKFEVYVVAFEDEDAKDDLQTALLSEELFGEVFEVDCVDLDWHDDIDINFSTTVDTYREYFIKKDTNT